MEAAFFDLDKTVIARASMVAFAKPLKRAGLISRWLLLRALYGQLVYMYLGADEEKLQRMKDSVLALTKGWHQDVVRDIVRETLEDVVDPIVYNEALELIHDHQAAGRRVFLISASPVEIVAPLADHLGVTDYLGTRAEIDDEGRYSGKMAFYCYGPQKAVAIREIAERDGIDLDASYGYSDSATDIPMLECVGHPVAVNPDRELLRTARENDWEVRWFSTSVRLRDRVPMPTAGQTAAAGGGLAAAAGAAALAYWWVRRQSPPPPPSRGWRRVGTSVRGGWSKLSAEAESLRQFEPSWRPRPRAQRG